MDFEGGGVMNNNESQGSGPSKSDADLQQAKKVTMAVYALQAASFVFGVTLIAAVILNYIKKEDVQGTWLASHFRWQMRTFWFGLLWGVIGGITLLLGVGFVILGVATVWFIYRIVKGWLRLSEGKEMYLNN
jgi:uncharacterized membrane protein